MSPPSEEHSGHESSTEGRYCDAGLPASHVDEVVPDCKKNPTVRIAASIRTHSEQFRCSSLTRRRTIPRSTSVLKIPSSERPTCSRIISKAPSHLV